ncbi:interferon-induced protein with tetratricopeptide repeats 5 [Biomphalaria pfeifferi]|uniref:Interferon-induced protein with tetratricopeptide repeats 5 n=1 Tax=Biomphalaria pfeifferi TaxID=112525 RepID=A0AAD8AZ20_BIOPF|nr:interferon-induced protein with tetratricopeptide repeats 5 [Biomphalaria pfeifferi]
MYDICIENITEIILNVYSHQMSAATEDEITFPEFPCNFNLVTGNKVSQQRFLHVKNNVTSDLELFRNSQEERIRDLNLLTWVLFNLNEKSEALEKNATVLELTNRRNVTALGNLVFLSQSRGYKIESDKYLEKLKELQNQPEFVRLKTEAIAEQAYSYSRLGGADNYKLCRRYFQQCTLKCPNNYLWKYGLALACKRLLNYNIQCTSKQPIDTEELKLECIELFFEVGERADSNLRGLAYAQLVNLRQVYSYPKINASRMFKAQNIHELLELARRFGGDNPAVLTQCGKSFKSIDVDKAIDILRQSLMLQENSTAYHHLGLCLSRKASLIAGGKYHSRNTRFGAHPSRYKSPTGYDPFVKLPFYVTNAFGQLDKDNPLVKEAIEYYHKAIDISHEENVPAKLSLADLYFSIDQLEHALAQYNQVIDQPEAKFLLCLISAHEGAGKCLQRLSNAATESNPERRRREAREQFTKGFSLAADLASKFSQSEIMIWDSLKQLINADEQSASNGARNNQTIKLLELMKNKDVSEVLNEMLKEDLEVNNVNDFEERLEHYIAERDFEGALAFLNLSRLHSVLVNDDSWSSSNLTDLKYKTYLAAAWNRVLKYSPDARRVFQQMFELTYGQCVGMVKEEDDDEVMESKVKHDVLIVSDTTHDCQMTLNVAENLYLVLKIVFGFDTVKYKVESSCFEHDQLSQAMENFSLTLWVLGDNDSGAYQKMLEEVRISLATEIIFMSVREKTKSPQILTRKQVLDLKKSPWKQTTLFEHCLRDQLVELSNKCIVEKLFHGNPQTLMKLFCFLVGENFDKREDLFSS